MRKWEEDFQLFINYLHRIPTISFKNVDTIFARKEHQKNKGNVSHGQMMIQLNWENMNQAETDFVNDIVCASIFTL